MSISKGRDTSRTYQKTPINQIILTTSNNLQTKFVSPLFNTSKALDEYTSSKKKANKRRAKST